MTGRKGGQSCWTFIIYYFFFFGLCFDFSARQDGSRAVDIFEQLWTSFQTLKLVAYLFVCFYIQYIYIYIFFLCVIDGDSSGPQ